MGSSRMRSPSTSSPGWALLSLLFPLPRTAPVRRKCSWVFNACGQTSAHSLVLAEVLQCRWYLGEECRCRRCCLSSFLKEFPSLVSKPSKPFLDSTGHFPFLVCLGLQPAPAGCLGGCLHIAGVDWILCAQDSTTDPRGLFWEHQPPCTCLAGWFG